MRITGGVLRSRRILVPKGDAVRPTQDRVREALFSSLGAKVPGCRFLDLFAGSGAVGLDAWSRGAAFVCWVERDPRSLSALRTNVEQLCSKAEGGGEGWRIARSDACSFLEHGLGGGPFDIIFADPPYDLEGHREWGPRLMQAILRGGALSVEGAFILEESRRRGLESCPAGWRLTGEKAYGETRLARFALGPGDGEAQHETRGGLSGNV